MDKFGRTSDFGWNIITFITSCNDRSVPWGDVITPGLTVQQHTYLDEGLVGDRLLSVAVRLEVGEGGVQHGLGEPGVVQISEQPLDVLAEGGAAGELAEGQPLDGHSHRLGAHDLVRATVLEHACPRGELIVIIFKINLNTYKL